MLVTHIHRRLLALQQLCWMWMQQRPGELCETVPCLSFHRRVMFVAVLELTFGVMLGFTVAL